MLTPDLLRHSARSGSPLWLSLGLAMLLTASVGLHSVHAAPLPVLESAVTEPTQPASSDPRWGDPSLLTPTHCLPPLCLAWSSGESYNFANVVAWGDYDSDGDLDLVTGNNWVGLRLYPNLGGALGTQAVWTGGVGEFTHAAWGDLDNDGDLDLAVARYGASGGAQVFLNHQGTLAASAVWSAADAAYGRSVAWGDVDGDGDLDLAVGIGGPTGLPNLLYRNDNGMLTASAVWVSAESDDTRSVAWGDYDGDGDLDLAVGNNLHYEAGCNCDIPEPNRLYRNDNGQLTASAVWSSSERDNTLSVAWGDYDGDGDLDLAAGNIGQPLRLYRNDLGLLTTGAAWSSSESGGTTSLAWGDYDNDGVLDLAAGGVGTNGGYPSLRLYHNAGGLLDPSAVWASTLSDDVTSIAWGDVDKDGDLDLAAANYQGPNRVYLNDTSLLAFWPGWSSTASDWTASVAWGDYDGDGHLDLAVGNGGTEMSQPSRVYHNLGQGLEMTPTWSSSESGSATSLAWGDVDGDGDLDLAQGNYNQPSRLYLNTGGGLQTIAGWATAESQATLSVAWGDVDGDGDLDLAVGNYGQPNQLYRNEPGGLVAAAEWTSTESDFTNSVAWGDVDGDGDLDLAVGNYGQPNRLYRNDQGSLTATGVWASAESDFTYSVAWGDVDGDGDLDLAAGNLGQPTRLYRNDGGQLTPVAVWSSVESYEVHSVTWSDYDNDGDLDLLAGGARLALYRNDQGTLTPEAIWVTAAVYDTRSTSWGDVDGDGDLDLAAGNRVAPEMVYFNAYGQHQLPGAAPTLRLGLPEAVGSGYATARIFSGLIPITYTLTGVPAAWLRASYSPDGGGQWFPAIAAGGTLTPELAAAGTHTFTWDTAASGFLGQSDNTVLRIEVVPAISTTRNSQPGPYWFSQAAAATFPFRVRGTQVRVISNTLPVSNAIVYRLPVGQTQGAAVIGDSQHHAFQTDAQGYLQGRGRLEPGDRLVALAPITGTDTYTLYYTSAAPSASGLNLDLVTGGGVQTLTVAAVHPLLLFPLEISIEWDASQDTAFLNQLRFNLQRASELLFDLTNGQAALGKLTVYYNRAHWNEAQVRLYADNQLRPYADIGGVVSTPAADPEVTGLIYNPGQINFPATWNRYGDPGVTIGDDWPRTLAHELSHYLFYLDDNYVGLDVDQHLTSVTTCAGSIMSDPYREDYSEYHGPAQWPAECAATLSNQLTGRSDWTTIGAFYSALTLTPNPGPSTLPLAVTLIQEAPYTPTAVLPDPRFYLTFNGARVQPGRQAQAYLFRTGQVLPLGRPVIDQVLARGAVISDTVCVFDLEAARLGCKTIATGDNQQLALTSVPAWQPDVRLTSVNSQTVSVQVWNLAEGLTLHAQLYDDTGMVSPVETLNWEAGSGTYTVPLVLSEPVLEAQVRLWVDEGPPQRQVVVSYALGGSPANKRSGFANKRSGFANKRSGFAPVLSGDGQVILYAPNLTFPDGEFYVLQAATHIPNPPSWATVIGQGYWLARSNNAPSLNGPSISMGYAQNSVPPGEEPYLRVYFWNANVWTALTTTVSLDDNYAVAPAQGPGLYVLLSSVEVPLFGPGWNLLSYPVQAAHPITNALASIADQYTLVYGFVPTDTVSPWRVFAAPGVPDYVNDLQTMEFGRAYWVYATADATFRISGAPVRPEAGLVPPATYYGVLTPEAGWTFAVGQTVTAWMDGTLCGQGPVRWLSGQWVYVIKVRAAGDGAAGCGAPGRSILFQVDARPLTPAPQWDNTQAWNEPLRPRWVFYLPVTRR